MGVSIGTATQGVRQAAGRTLRRLAQAAQAEGLLPGLSWELTCAADDRCTLHLWRSSPSERTAFTCPLSLLRWLATSRPTDGAEMHWEAAAEELSSSWRNEAAARAYRGVWHQHIVLHLPEPALAPHGLWHMLASDLVPAARALPFLRQLAAFEGHPTHPMAKTKLGLTLAEVVRFSPEFAQPVPIQLAALRRDAATVVRAPGNTADIGEILAEHFPLLLRAWQAELRALGLSEAEFLPLPVHPANVSHLQRTLPRLLAEQLLVLLPAAVVHLQPSLSLRTMTPAAAEAPHIKLPIPVQITSQPRYLSPVEAHDSPVLSGLLEDVLCAEDHFDGCLWVQREDIGVHLAYARHGFTYEQARYVSCLLRENPAALVRPGEVAVPLAALLLPSPLPPGTPLLEEAARTAGVDSPATARTYFAAYTQVVLRGVLRLLLQYGIALEAHQQNVVTVFSREGHLRRLLVQEMAGGLFACARMLALNHRDVSDQLHARQDSVVGPATLPVNVFMHTTVVSHLVPAARILGAGFDADIDRLLADVRGAVQQHVLAASQHADQVSDRAEYLALVVDMEARLLANDIEAKQLLTMRLLATKRETYRSVPNPLRAVSPPGP